MFLGYGMQVRVLLARRVKPGSNSCQHSWRELLIELILRVNAL